MQQLRRCNLNIRSDGFAAVFLCGCRHNIKISAKLLRQDIAVGLLNMLKLDLTCLMQDSRQTTLSELLSAV